MTLFGLADAAFGRGMKSLEMRDHLAEAEACFREGLKMDPDHAGCLLNLAVTLRNLGRLKEAEHALHRALGVSPEDPVVHMQLGTLRRWQKRLEESLRAYDAALQIAPDHVNTRVARSITLQEMNLWEEALAEYDSLIESLAPAEVEANALRRRRGEVAEVLARIAGTGADPRQPLQEVAAALYRRANQLVMGGSVDAAVRLYEDAAQLQPDYAADGFPIGETVAAQMARRPSGEYLSCRWLEESLHFQQYRLAFCCVSHTTGIDSAVAGAYHGGPVPIDFILARRQQLFEQNQAGIQNSCKGCPELEARTWERRSWMFRTLVVGNHSSCNQNCSYCALAQAHFEMPPYSYWAGPAIERLLTQGWIAPDPYLVWGGGEPTVSREFPTLITRLNPTKARFNILTNATLLKPILIDLLREGRCDIVTSVDSGTPTTFYRVKYMSDTPVLVQGRPAFDVVWETLSRYAGANRDGVLVKYVFTLETIAEDDLRGFVDLCLLNGISQVILSPEISDVLSGKVPDEVWDAIRTAKGLAREKGLQVFFSPLFLKSKNMPKDLLDSLDINDRSSHSRVTG